MAAGDSMQGSRGTYITEYCGSCGKPGADSRFEQQLPVIGRVNGYRKERQWLTITDQGKEKKM